MADISRNIIAEATVLVENNLTIRETAKKFGISKSTLYIDVTKRLEKKDAELYMRVREVLDKNLAEWHIRGGMAIKEKWNRFKED